MRVIYDYHLIAGVAAIVVALLSYGLYIRSILNGETKPHIFTWLTLGTIDVVVFAAQLAGGAGVGAYPLGISIVICSCIVILSLNKGEKHITTADKFFFISALVAILAWVFTKEPLSAVIILTAVNVLGTAPTFRKAFAQPFQESTTAWVGDIVRFALALVALEVFSFTTALFLVGIIVTNTALVLMILLRRRQLAKR